MPIKNVFRWTGSPAMTIAVYMGRKATNRTLYPLLSTGSTQEDPSLYNWKIVDGT